MCEDPRAFAISMYCINKMIENIRLGKQNNSHAKNLMQGKGYASASAEFDGLVYLGCEPLKGKAWLSLMRLAAKAKAKHAVTLCVQNSKPRDREPLWTLDPMTDRRHYTIH